MNDVQALGIIFFMVFMGWLQERFYQVNIPSSEETQEEPK